MARSMRPLILTALGLLVAIPTAAASDPPTGTRVEGDCVVVYDFPDAGYAVCSGRQECPLGLYERRTTFLGTEEECLL